MGSHVLVHGSSSHADSLSAPCPPTPRPPLSDQVTPTSENDYGSYNCSASNDLGTESKEFLLIQAGQSQTLTRHRHNTPPPPSPVIGSSSPPHRKSVSAGLTGTQPLP